MFCKHLVIHKNHQFNEYIMKLSYVLSYVLSIIMQTSLFTSVFITSKKYGKSISTIIFDLFLFTIVSPFLCAILAGRGSLDAFKLLSKTIFPFFATFYLMIPWFSSYVFARCWDVTSGRPADSKFGGKGGYGEQFNESVDPYCMHIIVQIDQHIS